MDNRYSSYPAGSDVQAILTNTGISLAAGLDYDGAAASAAAEWERKTGWFPFLASPPQTRYLSPPRSGPQAGRIMSAQGGKTLELDAGLLNLPDDGLLIGYVPSTADQIGVSQGFTDSLGSQGTVLTRGIQYYLIPDNAPQRGYPWTAIEFPDPTRGLLQSIVLSNAVFGRMLVLTPDIWMAIARYGAAVLAQEIALSISGGTVEQKLGDSMDKFAQGRDAGPLASESGVWEAKFSKLAQFYKRPFA